MRISSRRIVLYYLDGELKSAFAASVDGNVATNIMGQKFPLGKVLANMDLHTENERYIATKIRGYENAKAGKRLTPAQNDAWGWTKPAAIIAEVESPAK